MAETDAISAADVAAALGASAATAMQLSQSAGSSAAVTVEDINAIESLQSGLVTETRVHNANLKRNLLNHESLDLGTLSEYADVRAERARFNNRFSEAMGMELVYGMAEQRGARARDVYHSEDRFWNNDEVAELTAKTPVQLDIASSAALIELLKKNA